MRDAYLDRCKATLIFLVVLGHFLERMIGWKDPIAHTLLGTIYFIHMPAFIFVSGILFKDKNWLKNIFFFLSLYVPFQILFPVFDAIWSGQFKFNWNIFERPYWILWYLQGMVLWTLLAHLLIKIKFPIAVSLIFALCIGLGPWNNYQYSIGRIFTFFPFFMLGVVYGKMILQKIQRFKFSSIFAGVIILGIASYVYFSQLNQFWLYGSLSYTQLRVNRWDGTWMRVGLLLTSSLGICAIFALVKCLNLRFIQLGQNTLPVYLLHGFVVMLIARYLTLDLNIFIGIGICIALSVLTCWLLQQQFFDQLLRKLSWWLMKPIRYLGIK